ncbi:hypothetical protein BJ508DRAFT_302581 [Ascobolus immersus RN42]|uniref:Uncharacterized protein n=1 Tax=Ascobolus immersus RN42 TaxID=1160509 RepID=A0A3N4IHY4_ASCIM|nr:hypothetical protein BJ508DRAFT_302581 [Ascobolus immersus RN42]
MKLTSVRTLKTRKPALRSCINSGAGMPLSHSGGLVESTLEAGRVASALSYPYPLNLQLPSDYPFNIPPQEDMQVSSPEEASHPEPHVESSHLYCEFGMKDKWKYPLADLMCSDDVETCRGGCGRSVCTMLEAALAPLESIDFGTAENALQRSLIKAMQKGVYIAANYYNAHLLEELLGRIAVAMELLFQKMWLGWGYSVTGAMEMLGSNETRTFDWVLSP